MDRLHPQDLRAIMVAQLALMACDGLTDRDVSRGMDAADFILAKLERTARPIPSPGLEPPSPLPRGIDRLIKEGAEDEWWKAYHRGVSEGMAKANAEADRLKGSMALIISMAGNPDPAEACRLIIAEAKRSLGLDPA